MSEIKRVVFTTITTNSIVSSSNCSSTANNTSNNNNSNNNCIGGGGGGISSIITGTDGSVSSLSSNSKKTLTTNSIVGGSSSTDLMTSQQQSTSTSKTSSAKTIRLELQLFEPNSGSSPEFNYLELIKVEKKKLKKISRVNGFLDPFEENDDDDVERIAKEFEKKYGSSVVGQGKRRTKRDDWYDKGAGYDISDSFIDNTEAYDEIIPDEMETIEGGFYINSGSLQFKQLSNYDNKIPGDIRKLNNNKPQRKRTLSTSSSSSDDDDDEDDDDEDDDDDDEEEAEETNEAEEEGEETEGVEGNSSPRHSIAPVALSSSAANINSIKLKNSHIEKKLKTSSGGEASDKETASAKSSSSSTSSNVKHQQRSNKPPKLKDDVKIDEMLVDPIKERDKEKTAAVKTTTVKDMLKAKRDNFRKMLENNDNKVKSLSNGGVSGSGERSAASTNDSTDTSEDSDDSDNAPTEKRLKKTDDDEHGKLRANDVKLPDNLNAELLKDIQEMKEIGKLQLQFSSNFQFDGKIVDVFLRIDDACLCVDKFTRNLIFAHIEYNLSLPKYCLLRKAKQVRIKQEKDKIRRSLTKLKKAVNEVMPSVLAQYEGNYKKIEEIRKAISPADLDKMEHPPKYPKKKFPWNENLRTLLYELYQTRLMSYTVLKTKKDEFEEFISSYLKENAVPIWPSGWMKYEDLKKEIEKKKISTKIAKDKRPPVVVDLTTTQQPQQQQHNEYFSGNSTAIATTSSQSIDVTKSCLASSNSLSVVSTRDLVVTIANTKNNNGNNGSGGSRSELLSIEVPNSLSSSTSQSMNSLTITQVPITTAVSSGNMSNNSSIEHQHLKNNTKSNIDKGNNNVNSHQMKSLNSPTCGLTSSNTCTGPLDLVSPSKRSSTDHSINSIMSTSPTLIPTQNDASTTHVINVDNLKNAAEIINTTNQLLSNSPNDNNDAISRNSSINSSTLKENSLKIRNFAAVTETSSSSSSTTTATTIKQRSSSISSTTSNNNSGGKFIKQEQELQDSSSESDGVEIVGVYPAGNKKPSQQTQQKCVTTSDKHKSKHKKSNKTSSSSSRSVSPAMASTNSVSLTSQAQNLNKIGKLAADIKESEYEYDNIMKALKELEEMQQPKSYRTSSSSSSSKNSKH